MTGAYDTGGLESSQERVAPEFYTLSFLERRYPDSSMLSAMDSHVASSPSIDMSSRDQKNRHEDIVRSVNCVRVLRQVMTLCGHRRVSPTLFVRIYSAAPPPPLTSFLLVSSCVPYQAPSSTNPRPEEDHPRDCGADDAGE